MNNICYKVLHIPGLSLEADKRALCAEEIEFYLQAKYNKLDSEMILIEKEEDYTSFNDKYNLFEAGSHLKYGEIGIWASHMVALSNFVKTDNDYLVLIEDDIMIKPEFSEKLEGWLKMLPDSCDFFAPFVPLHFFRNCPEELKFSEISRIYFSWGLNVCVWTKRGAYDMLNRAKNFGLHQSIDTYMFANLEGWTITSIVEPVCEDMILSSTTQTSFVRNTNRRSWTPTWSKKDMEFYGKDLL